MGQTPPKEIVFPDPEEEIHFEWEFCKEFFQELTVNVKELYHYEATLKKLG